MACTDRFGVTPRSNRRRPISCAPSTHLARCVGSAILLNTLQRTIRKEARTAASDPTLRAPRPLELPVSTADRPDDASARPAPASPAGPSVYAAQYPTVADVLGLGPVKQGGPRVVAGAAGLDRVVRWVHVTELVDVATILRGGELVLSTGIA